ncbi:MAG: glyoxalase [Lachnospiraceae bacterium]|nr:glyoxalase [Lachnospiraceae bacterium]
MTNTYDEKVLDVFLKDQGKLFPEPVAENREEAKEFLEDILAVVVDSIEEVMDYMDEAGMDIAEMSKEEVEAAEEVFAVGDGRYLIVEA